MNEPDTRHIAVVTLFPEMFEAISCCGITGRAVRDGRVHLDILNPRDFTQDKHRSVDDRPYGGGPGMVMMVQPLRETVHALKSRLQAKLQPPSKLKTIYLSPQGRVLDQRGLQELAQCPGIILVAGRYEGVDERFVETEIDEEWSIGDYVLSGGELAAMVIIDGITRLLPGALGDQDSADQDSFGAGLLDYPHYTRPETIDGRVVPPVLLSGDHRAIARWRTKQALGRTWLRRPELLDHLQLTELQKELLEEFKRDR